MSLMRRRKLPEPLQERFRIEPLLKIAIESQPHQFCILTRDRLEKTTGKLGNTLEPYRSFRPSLPGERQVEEHHIGLENPCCCDGLSSVEGERDLIAFLLQHALHNSC